MAKTEILLEHSSMVKNNSLTKKFIDQKCP